jgi:hypothetical protein
VKFSHSISEKKEKINVNLKRKKNVIEKNQKKKIFAISLIKLFHFEV